MFSLLETLTDTTIVLWVDLLRPCSCHSLPNQRRAQKHRKAPPAQMNPLSGPTIEMCLFPALYMAFNAPGVMSDGASCPPGALALCTCDGYSFWHTRRISYVPNSLPGMRALGGRI